MYNTLEDKTSIIAILITVIFVVGIFNGIDVVTLAFMMVFFIFIMFVGVILVEQLGGMF